MRDCAAVADWALGLLESCSAMAFIGETPADSPFTNWGACRADAGSEENSMDRRTFLMTLAALGAGVVGHLDLAQGEPPQIAWRGSAR